MLHEDYPVTLFPKAPEAQERLAFYVNLQTQQYALKPVSAKTRLRAIVQCGQTLIYHGRGFPKHLKNLAAPLVSLRQLKPLNLRSTLFTAKHLVTFWESHAQCPRCQQKTIVVGGEGEIVCSSCSYEGFTPISPAVIVGIVREGKLLVTRYAHRPYTGPALVAGYCAVGETLEATCAREALEETNLEVKGPFHYFGSQPWGLSNSLLMGFFVKATKRRKLILADGELAHAEWLTPEECQKCLPEEGPISLTATMIKAFSKGLIPFA